MKVSHETYYNKSLKSDVIKSQLVLQKSTPTKCEQVSISGKDVKKFIEARHTQSFRVMLYGDIQNKIKYALSTIRAGDKEGADKCLTEVLDIIERII